MSKWTKVYALEGVTDFYADDDFEDALREVFGEEPDLSVKVRITVENDEKAAAELSALRERVEALEHLEAVAQDVNEWLKTSAGLKGSAHQRELEAALQSP